MDAPKQVRSATGLKILERIRKLCGRLPEVSEVIDGFGHTSFRVRKKSFLIVGEDEGEASLAIKSDPVNQEVLVRRGAFVRTPYIGQHGWVSVKNTRSMDWTLIEELIVDAYRSAAPARLVKLLD
jgi:predicted DNA-binding protein (MmcQ/YjbR family)